MGENEIRFFGYCEECGNAIVDTAEEAYLDGAGHYFCSAECALDYYDIHKVEI